MRASCATPGQAANRRFGILQDYMSELVGSYGENGNPRNASRRAGSVAAGAQSHIASRSNGHPASLMVSPNGGRQHGADGQPLESFGLSGTDDRRSRRAEQPAVLSAMWRMANRVGGGPHARVFRVRWHLDSKGAGRGDRDGDVRTAVPRPDLIRRGYDPDESDNQAVARPHAVLSPTLQARQRLLRGRPANLWRS